MHFSMLHSPALTSVTYACKLVSLAMLAYWLSALLAAKLRTKVASCFHYWHLLSTNYYTSAFPQATMATKHSTS